MKNRYPITRWLLAAAVPAVLLTACSKDEVPGKPDGIGTESGDIRFEIGFAAPAATAEAGLPQTRATTASDFTSAWEDGDEIGVFAVASGTALSATASGNYIHNAKLTYNGSSWTQAEPLYWPRTAEKIPELDFYAYYPYDASAADPTAIAFSVKADQGGTTSGKSNYDLSDLLTAKSTGNVKGSAVQLTFSHALAMVQVAIPGGKGWGGGIEGLTVTLRGVQTESTLDLSAVNGTTPGSGISVPATGNDAAGITMYRMAEPSDGNFLYRALVPAQTLAQGRSLFFFDTGDRQVFTDGALASDLTMTAGTAEIFERTLPVVETGTRIPAGTFLMSSPADEPGRDLDETQHRVTLTEDFYMAKYPVTNAQYAAFLNAKHAEGVLEYGTAGGYTNAAYLTGSADEPLVRDSRSDYRLFKWGVTRNSSDGSWSPVSGYEDNPVIYVTWYGAKAFADYYGYRLPTEAQWEYACRGGQTESLPFGIGDGRKLTGDMANFAVILPYDLDNGGTYRDESWSSFRVGKTTPVGKYPYANGYGLYDMHGNVMEWCADWYDRKFGSANAADDAIDPTGRDTGSYRVIRGGDWEDRGGYCRTACRVYETPDYADYRVGFRVVVVP